MPKKKLTARSLEALKPPETGQLDVFDLGGPPGFLVRVSYGGTKTFQLMYRRNGKLKRWTIGRFPSMTLAEARERAKKLDANNEDPVGRKAELKRAGTFKDLAEQFLSANEKRLKAKTIGEWRRIIDNELVPEFGSMNPHAITRGDIKAVLNEKAETAPYMANRLFETIRRIYSWGVEEDKVTASPCVGIKKPGGKEPPRERVLSAEEIRNVWNALDKERPLIANFFKLLFLTAVRRGEALGARWDDFDFEQKLWTIPDTKMNRSHTIPLSEASIDVLQTLYPLTGQSEWVFMGPTGANVQNPQKAVVRVRKNSKVQFRIHDIRRTVATGLAQIGVTTDVISAVMNHVISGPSATRIYERHHRIPEMRRALDKWARELDRIVMGREAEVVPFGKP